MVEFPNPTTRRREAMLNEKQKELAVLVTKDLVIKMIEQPNESGAHSNLDITKAFSDILHGVAAAMKNILNQS
jgi:hypothetical protein